MDPLDEPSTERDDHTLTLIMALIISGLGAALAVGLIAGLLGWNEPNCGSNTTNRTGRCGSDGYMNTESSPVIPTFDASRFRIVPPPFVALPLVAPTPECSRPAEVAGAAAAELTRCMSPDARAADFEKTLADWHFLRPASAEQPLGVGGAVDADVLPGGASSSCSAGRRGRSPLTRPACPVAHPWASHGAVGRGRWPKPPMSPATGWLRGNRAIAAP